MMKGGFPAMMVQYARRMLKETDRRVLWKIAYNFGYKGIRSVQLYKKRLKKGIHFPPFLFISIINSCQLKCQGCWVDVKSPRTMISLDEMNRLINDAKKTWQQFFRHFRRRTVSASAVVANAGSSPRLLFPDIYQWTFHH